MYASTSGELRARLQQAAAKVTVLAKLLQGDFLKLWRELVGYMQQAVEGHPDPVHVLGVGPKLLYNPRPDPHRQGRVLLRQIQEQLVQGSDRPLVLVGDFDGQREILLHRLGVQEAVVNGQVPGGHTAAFHQEPRAARFPRWRVLSEGT